MSIPLQLLLLLGLVSVNAFFASAEMAIVSVNKLNIIELAENGSKKAKKLLKVMEDESKFLSTIQIGITFAGFFSAASASTGMAGPLATLLEKINVPYNTAHTISVIVITLILSYFTLVVGELFPKKLALQNKEKIALRSAPIIYVLMKILIPFIKLLSGSTNALLYITGNQKETFDEEFSTNEIRRIIRAGHASGVLTEREEKMINSVFALDDYDASDIMTPRKLVFAIDINDDLKDFVDELIETNFSRVPVYEGEIDNVIGILYYKDFYREARKVGFENVNIRKLLRAPLFATDVKRASVLFQEMQSTNTHIAIIIDEFGGFSGIVTLEDLVEEIVGNIYDEHEEVDLKQIAPDTFIVKGNVPIQDINRLLNSKIPISTDDSYDSIGGLIIYLLERLPEEEDVNKIVSYENLDFTIMTINENVIEKVKIKKNPVLIEKD
ncbi:MAG: hemolysin family protein [Bacilli bacterium]|nr:hemolysin family protein [Bacilli bacterium]MDD2682129.1 hemolysin family protein [Bacilli bacterium]MDD3121663.1 hemolysin family protein [Bacilli bacterium]MDD4063740.1 hemolysin family protein [Bacilli bacterium]MDD4482441.1 hemolysin family protein [Bacilli bacterium]